MHSRSGLLVLTFAFCALLTHARLGEGEQPDVEWDEDAFVAELAERMKPRELTCPADTNTASPRQFFHLHHMKTGGTSVSHLISCAVSRLQRDLNMTAPSYGLSECAGASYQKCISNPEDRCRSSVEKSAVMTYCAPLFQTNEFEWANASAVTVVRHPVDRVWSMFRFQTKGCYKCIELKDFYKRVDDGTVEELYEGRSDDAKLCVAQLLNHQTRNLLTSPMSQSFTEEDQIHEALFNLRNRFTVVGLTEELQTTVQMLGQSFPWLAEHVKESATNCSLPHANASPSNNRCGPGNTHWDLPPHPDEETRQAIIDHNHLDVQLYEAAVQHFELQKRALGWAEETD